MFVMNILFSLSSTHPISLISYLRITSIISYFSLFLFLGMGRWYISNGFMPLHSDVYLYLMFPGVALGSIRMLRPCFIMNLPCFVCTRFGFEFMYNMLFACHWSIDQFNIFIIDPFMFF